MNHEDFIRIRNLEEADTECFQGIGAAISINAGGTLPTPAAPTPLTPETPPLEPLAPGEKPVTPAEKKAFDLKNAWAAQQKLTGTLINFLSELEAGADTDAGNIVTDYIRLLEATKSFSASLDAFNVNRDALAELPMIWHTLDRQPSKDMVKFVEEADAYAGKLETWFENGLTALYDRDTAIEAIDAAKTLLSAANTEAETTAAQAALDAANAQLTTAEGEMTANESQLPVETLPQKMVALMVLARAVMTGNWMLVGVTLVRIVVPLLIDYLAKWISGKLPGKQPTPQDLQPIVDALRDIALKDATIKFGDNAALHLQARLLEY